MKIGSWGEKKNTMLPLPIIITILFSLPRMHALTGTASQENCAVEERMSVTGWRSGEGYCNALGGRLCTRDEYCPGGSNTIPLGGLKTNHQTRQWAPTSDGINTWVMLSNFSNTNGHVAVVLDDTAASTADDPMCFHNDMTIAPASTLVSNVDTPTVVLCCNMITGDGKRFSSECANARDYEHARSYCAGKNGYRLCTYQEAIRLRNPIDGQNSPTLDCYGQDPSIDQKRTWTSTPCVANMLPHGISNEKLPEHPDLPCSLNTEVEEGTSYDQLGDSSEYAVSSILPSGTASAGPNMVDIKNETSYWEPGTDSGGGFVLDVGRVGMSPTHVRILSSGADSFDLIIYITYQGSETSTQLSSVTVKPATRVYSIMDSERNLASYTNLNAGPKLYRFHITGKTGAGNIRIHDVALLSKSGPNPAWGMIDSIGGRPFLGHIKCCDVPSVNTTDVHISNYEGGGAGVGGWSCQLNDAGIDSIRVGTYIDSWYDTSVGCSSEGYMLWTVTIASEALTSSLNVAVTQTGTNGVGTLNVELDGTTTTTLIIRSAFGQIFDTAADLVIATDPVTTVALANLQSVAYNMVYTSHPNGLDTSVECTQMKVYTDVACANHCGILHTSTNSDTDAFMWSRDFVSDTCVCKTTVAENNATQAYTSISTATSGVSSTCHRKIDFLSCRDAYERGWSRDGTYYVNGRETWCEMSISGGGWELVAYATGKSASSWPNTNNDLKADGTSSGTYDPEWNTDGNSEHVTNFFRNFTHLVPNGVGDETELLFLTGDRSAFCSLRYEDVAITEQTSFDRMNAQILDSSSPEEMLSGSSDTNMKNFPKGAWTNVKVSNSGAFTPVVVCNGINADSGVNVWWSEGGATNRRSYRCSHQGVGVLARRGEPTRCRTTSGGGRMKKTYEKALSANTVGRIGGATWPSLHLDLMSIASTATTCTAGLVGLGGSMNHLIDGDFNTGWSICPVSSVSASASAQDATQEEVEIDVAISWGAAAESWRFSMGAYDGVSIFVGSDDGGHRVGGGGDQLPYEGTSSPCLHQVDIVWSVNKSASLYNLLASNDGVNYHPIVTHATGCRDEDVANVDHTWDSCVDHHDISSHPHRGKYLRMQIVGTGSIIAESSTNNDEQDWTHQQSIDTLKYELREIRVMGSVCEHDFESGAITSVVQVDVGENGQVTESSNDAVVALNAPVSSSASSSFNSAMSSSDLLISNPALTSNSTSLSITVGASSSSQLTASSFSPQLATLNSSDQVLYGYGVDSLMTDGVYTTSGVLSISIRGLSPGYHAIETRHHDPSSSRSVLPFDVYMPKRKSPLVHRQYPTFGSGNITEANDKVRQRGRVRLIAKVLDDTSASSTIVAGETVNLEYTTSAESTGPLFTSNTINLNGVQWSDQDINGVANGWYTSPTTSGTDLVNAKICDVLSLEEGEGAAGTSWGDYTTFSGKYQQISTQETSVLNLTFPAAIMAGVAYDLSFHYMTNFTTLTVIAGEANLLLYNDEHFTSETRTRSRSEGIHEGPLDSTNMNSNTGSNGLLLNYAAYFYQRFRSLSDGSLTITVTTTSTETAITSMLRIDNVLLSPVYSGVGGTRTWQSSSDKCSSRGLQLCTYDDYCPHGPGTTPIGGGFLTSAITNTQEIVERWVPYKKSTNEKYGWLKVESSRGSAPWVIDRDTCNDSPPPGLASCSEYTSGACASGSMIWTFTINSETLTATSLDAAVTQASSSGVGTLNVALDGSSTTVIVVQSAIGQVFDKTADLVIGGVSGVTVALANLVSVTSVNMKNIVEIGHCCKSCNTCSITCKRNQVSWSKVLSTGTYGAYDLGRDMIDGLFALSGNSDLTANIIARDCFDCTSIDHRLIYYRRLTAIPRSLSIYDMITSNFLSDGNLLNTDFELYTSYSDAISRTNRWTSCGYATMSGIGFPGTCGPSAASSGQWNSHDNTASGGTSNYAYYVKASKSSTCVPNTTDVETTGSPRQSSQNDLLNGAPNSSVPVEITGDYMCCANHDACDAPLGMESGAIADSQLSDTGASLLSQKRLNINVGSANGWIFPGPAGLLHPFGTSYYQVDLLRSYSISGIGTQGRGDKNQWVSTYKVSYATKDSHWRYVQQRNVNDGTFVDHLFTGNNDRSTVVKNLFDAPVVAKYLRVYPMSANSITALRLEFYGGDVSRCAPSLVYGSRIMLRNIAANVFLHADTTSNHQPKFTALDGGISSQFWIRHPGSNSNSQVSDLAISYGDRVSFQHVLTGMFLSYNMGSSEDTNIALSSFGTVVSVSGSMDEASYPPALMVDGNYQFGWQSATGNTSTIILDTQNAHIVSGIRVSWNLLRAASSVTVSRSLDNVEWVTVSSLNNLLCYTNLRVDDINGWSEPTRYIRFVLNGACNSWSSDEDKPFFEILQIQMTGRREDTYGSEFVGDNTLVNTTFQLLNGNIQTSQNSRADTCTPTVTSSPVRVSSFREAPTSSIMLRRMGTSTSFGCYLGIDANGVATSELLGSGVDLQSNYALDQNKKNRYEIHTVDPISRKIMLNTIIISTNSTAPPQVRWNTNNAITDLSYDRVTLNWDTPSDHGGPSLLDYNITGVGILHQIIAVDMRAVSARGSTDQFSISCGGVTSVTTTCLAWDSTADDVRDAILNANLTGYYDTRAVCKFFLFFLSKLRVSVKYINSHFIYLFVL